MFAPTASGNVDPARDFTDATTGPGSAADIAVH